MGSEMPDPNEERKVELTDKIIEDKFKDEHRHYGLPEAAGKRALEAKEDFHELSELTGSPGKAETLLRQREQELRTSDAKEIERLRYDLGIPQDKASESDEQAA